MSVLGAHLTMKSRDGNVTGSHFEDIVIDGDGDQDVTTSSAMIEALVRSLSKTYPWIRKVVFVSDNGSHFASYDIMYVIYRMNARLHAEGSNLMVVRYVFTEAQWGKSRLDTHFSYSKGTLRAWVASGHHVLTPKDIFVGLTRDRDDGSGLVQASSVALVKPHPVKMAKGSRAPTNMWRAASGGMGIRSVADCQFNDNASMVVSQLSNLPGRTIDMNKANLAKWSSEDMRDYYLDGGSRINTEDPCCFQKSPVSLLAPTDRQNRIVKASAASSWRQALTDGYSRFMNQHTVSTEASEHIRRSRQVSVAAAISSVAGVQISTTTLGRASAGQTERPVVTNDIGGAGSLFGLLSGHARRRNEKSAYIPVAIVKYCKRIYDLGATENIKRSAYQVHQDLCKSDAFRRDWYALVLVTPTRIKEWFKQWTTTKKATQRVAAAVASSRAAASESPASQCGVPAQTMEPAPSTLYSDKHLVVTTQHDEISDIIVDVSQVQDGLHLASL